MLERQLEYVLTVRQEVVYHGDATPRATGCSVDAIPLGHVAGVRVSPRTGAGVWVADRQTTDLGRGGEVRVQQGRRQHLDIGDVVEVGTLRVWRQVVPSSHFEIQEVEHRCLVLGAVETLKGSTAGVGVSGCQLVEARLEGYR